MDRFKNFGVALAAIGFTLLSLGFLGEGFLVGVFSCSILVLYFKEKNEYSLLLLQVYFLCANLVGLVKLL